MAFVVVYDACVLFPAPLRDLLMRLGTSGLVQAKWTDKILDECFTNLKQARPELRAEALQKTRTLMNAAVRDCLVTGYENLIDAITLPDPDDRHVVAAAIRAGAQVIVTANLRDFPDDTLKPLGIEAQSPDDFVFNQIDLAPGAVSAIVAQQAASLKNPPQTTQQLLDTLLANGLPRSVANSRSCSLEPPREREPHRSRSPRSSRAPRTATHLLRAQRNQAELRHWRPRWFDSGPGHSPPPPHAGPARDGVLPPIASPTARTRESSAPRGRHVERRDDYFTAFTRGRFSSVSSRSGTA
jgi:hypothetical protein